MKSKRPYLIRAFYNWINESNCIPCLLVDATMAGVNLPENFLNQSEVVLNISPSAVREFVIGENYIDFCAQFQGIPHNIYIPLRAVLSIYAHENGQGIFFDQTIEAFQDDDVDEPQPKEAKPARVLRSVKTDGNSDKPTKTKKVLSKLKTKKKGRPNLKVIK